MCHVPLSGRSTCSHVQNCRRRAAGAWLRRGPTPGVMTWGGAGAPGAGPHYNGSGKGSAHEDGNLDRGDAGSGMRGGPGGQRSDRWHVRGRQELRVDVHRSVADGIGRMPRRWPARTTFHRDDGRWASQTRDTGTGHLATAGRAILTTLGDDLSRLHGEDVERDLFRRCRAIMLRSAARYPPSTT